MLSAIHLRYRNPFREPFFRKVHVYIPRSSEIIHFSRYAKASHQSDLTASYGILVSPEVKGSTSRNQSPINPNPEPHDTLFYSCKVDIDTISRNT